MLLIGSTERQSWQMLRGGICSLPFYAHPVCKTALRRASDRRPFSYQSPVEPDLNKKPFYVTTPIFYPNAAPHIGHLQSMVTADVLARWSQWRHNGHSQLHIPQSPEYEKNHAASQLIQSQIVQSMPKSEDELRVVLATGTDEHGSKIEKAALALNESPRTLCDRLSQRFKELANAGGVQYSRFIRTTDEDHIALVQQTWSQLMRDGFIYKGKHSGWYSVVDEAFYTESQIEQDAEGTHISKETGNAVEWTEEENYKFRLSMFEKPIRSWLESHSARVVPHTRYQATLLELDEGLQDLSISRPRSRLSWGIRVPDDEEQTMYVWFDALLNYLTVGKQFSCWPADVLVVGKDIIRFHAIFFPAFLLALGKPLPRQIVTHGHWTVDNFKMSKSRGNVVDPFMALQVCGSDEIRYFMIRLAGNLHKDVSWLNDTLIHYRKKYLQSMLGNYLSRVVSPFMVNRVLDPSGEDVQTINAPDVFNEEDEELFAKLRRVATKVDDRMARFELSAALSAIFDGLDRSQKQWTNVFEQAKDLEKGSDAERRHVWRGVYASMEALRIAALLLQHVMPTKAEAMLHALEIDPSERTFQHAKKLRESVKLTRRTEKLEHLFAALSEKDMELLG